jgi:hypothetical protein
MAILVYIIEYILVKVMPRQTFSHISYNPK